jgi:predicted nucleic acid-binding protein
MSYLWDTNTVIYYLQQQFPAVAEAYMDDLVEQYIPVISAITEIELLSWKSASPQDITVIGNFIRDARIIELESDVKIKTADIRKIHGLKMPDAIIAAAALVHDLTLLTRNVGDFKKIPQLNIINPWEPPQNINQKAGLAY